MTPVRCEEVGLSVMAELDGERPSPRRAEIEAHLVSCAACRQAREEQIAVQVALAGRSRSRPAGPSVWPAVSLGITAKGAESKVTRAMAVFGAGLVLARVAMLTADFTPGWAAQLLIVLVLAALFGVLRVNPFRVESSLSAVGKPSA